MRRVLLCILLLSLCFADDAAAQRRSSRKKTKKKTTKTVQRPTPSRDTAIRGTTIEILQNYTPEIKSTPKPDFAPTLPPPDTKLPVFTYDVPKQSLYYTYNALPIRPLALGREMHELPFSNYIKVGAGNLSTLYLDAGVGSLRGENYESAIHLNHLSQTGEFDDQKTSLSGLDADGTIYLHEHALHANLAVSQNQYHYYGYNHEVFNYGIDSLKQAFTTVRFTADLKNTTENTRGINYHPAISASRFADKLDASEQSINLDIPVSYTTPDNIELSIGLNAALTQYDVKALSIDNNILKLTPAVRYQKDELTLRAGLYPTMGKSKNYILPDIEASYKLKNNGLIISAGWLGTLKQNTYEQLSTTNPYMYNTYLVRQTNSNEIFGRVRGNVGNHIHFSGGISFTLYDNLPQFINDTSTADIKQFIVTYDKANVLSLQAAARYQVANTISAGLSLQVNSYSTETFRNAWHLPATVVKADFTMTPLESLTVTAYLSLLNGLYALDKGNTSIQLQPVTDLGGNAEYSFTKRLSAFLTVNNLLNNKYQRWYGYNAYGLNLYGGIRLKF